MDGRLAATHVEHAAVSIADLGETLLLHDALAEMLGSSRENDGEYRYMVHLLKRQLRELGIFLISVPCKGYKTVPRGEEIDVCGGKFKRGLKAAARGLRDTQYIRLEKLTDAQKEKTIAEIQKMSNCMAMITQGAPQKISRPRLELAEASL